jgi:hypothetical protein
MGSRGILLISNIQEKGTSRAKDLLQCMFEEFAYGDGDISSMKTLSKMMICNTDTVKRTGTI